LYRAPGRCEAGQSLYGFVYIAAIVSVLGFKFFQLALGHAKFKRRSSGILPNGFLLLLGFPNYKEEESVLFFKNLIEEKKKK
jgi:hypothetical protein